MAKTKKAISRYFNKESKKDPEVMIRESFHQTCVEIFDAMGLETWTIERVQGALAMLEKFVEIRDSDYK